MLAHLNCASIINNNAMNNLKPILLLIVLSVFTLVSGFAQTKTYPVQWKKVEDLVKKNLPKSALEEVRSIYAMAKKDKQDAQVIKSLLYIYNLQEQSREDNNVKSITELEK